MKLGLLMKKRNFIGISIFLAIVAPVVILAVYSYIKTQKELTSYTFTQKSSQAHLTAITLNERFDRIVDIAVSLSTRVNMRKLIAQGKWEEAIKILSSIPSDFPFIERLMFADSQGILRADTPEILAVRGKDFSFRDWYKGVIKTNSIYISEIYQRAAEPRYNVVAIAAPIKETGRLIGILVIQIKLDVFLDWAKGIESSPQALVYFIDQKGKVAAHPDASSQGEIKDYSNLAIVQKILKGEGGVEVIYNPLKNEEQLVAFEPIPKYGWGVIVEKPAKVAFATRDQNLKRISVFYGLIFLISCLCAYLILRNTTKIKQAEQTLKASEERFRSVTQTAKEAIVLANGSGNIILWNQGAQTIFGYTEKEALGRPLTLLMPERYQNLHRQGLERFLQTGEPRVVGKTVELHGRRKDGSEFPLELSLSSWKTGNAIFFSGILRDITERKQMEETLRDSEQRYRLLFERNPLPAWVFDLETLSFLAVNLAAVRHYGYSQEEFLSLTIKDIRPAEDIPALLERVSKLKEGVHSPGEWRHLKKDGTILDVEIASHPLTFGGRPAELVLANDITERKQAEEELKRLNQTLKSQATQLEAANKELEAFSYSVSHDLRAPLRSIDGFSLALLEDYGAKLNQEGKSNIERVRAGCKRMGQLIDDMLNLSRLSRTEMKPQKVNLTAVAQEVIQELKDTEPQRKANFVIPDNLFAHCDLQLIRAVLENLLGNAWKYTSKHPQAKIELGSLNQNGKAVFYVKDDGAGFDMTYADKLFSAFQRLHRMDEFIGNGVGLATVKRVIHRHGGEVWAEAQVEKGATFYFTLPTQKEEI